MLRKARQTLTAALTLGIGMSAAWAAVPAPPVNQSLGFGDTYFNALAEADCRGCHENNWVDPTGIPDRHHLLVGAAIPVGACNYSKDVDGVTPLACVSDAGCQTDPAQLRCKHASSVTCATDVDCDAVAYCDHGMCLDGVTACATTADCTNASAFGDAGACTNRDYCKGETEAPNALLTDTAYECLDCHEMVFNPITFSYELAQNFRDCRICHNAGYQPLYDEPGHLRGQEANQHHRTVAARDQGDCALCHGSIVNDGIKEYVASGKDPAYVPAWLPTYAPSMVTPYPSGKPNAGPNGEGNCNFCHDAGTEGTIDVVDNHDTHHLALSTSGVAGIGCTTCHDSTWMGNGRVMTGESVRACEYCHGIPTLHNIAVDTDGVGFCSGNPAVVCVVDADCTAAAAGVCVLVDAGNEAAGYSHIGHNDDCVGCHGNDGTAVAFTGAPGQGVNTPQIIALECTNMYKGSTTAECIADGMAFRDSPMAGVLLEAEPEVLIGGVAAPTTVTAMSDTSMAFTIDQAIPTGNMMIRVVKNNPYTGARMKNSSLRVKTVGKNPAVSSAIYSRRDGSVVVAGSDLGQYTGAGPQGPSAVTNVQCTIRNRGSVTIEFADIVSWDNTAIEGNISGCPTSCVVATVWGDVQTTVTCTK